ncbi:hypothetical protein Tsubulata_007079 [Turnera subulata]|uniref:DUF4283 domain-containing protein n=1 Tax=Turnera subulata TaxID=218843 RepID=A0A9Q0FW03_9ROSI|nr:hypothetical protein Tsubulata_007079 [Turnera subulata]
MSSHVSSIAASLPPPLPPPAKPPDIQPIPLAHDGSDIDGCNGAPDAEMTEGPVSVPLVPNRPFWILCCRTKRRPVRLPNLPLMYYDDDLLTTIALGIGCPVLIDSNTSMATCTLYAHMCVEIDLSLPLVPLVEIQGEVFRVQYEGLHTICMSCGRYGYEAHTCLFDPPDEPLFPVEVVEPESSVVVGAGGASQVVMRVPPLAPPQKVAAFGEWMVVVRPPRSAPRQRTIGMGSRGTDSGYQAPPDNRFTVLDVEDVPPRASVLPPKPTLGDFVSANPRRPKRVWPNGSKRKQVVVFSAGSELPSTDVEGTYRGCWLGLPRLHLLPILFPLPPWLLQVLTRFLLGLFLRYLLCLLWCFRALLALRVVLRSFG